MSQELCYTSAPRGLLPGTRGYCTVACTAHMPSALIERLEGLSVYRNLFPPHDARSRSSLNPVAFSHVRATVAGSTWSVLSRICFAGLDYTHRTNKFAHHVALEAKELPSAGPAWLLGRPGFTRASWDGQPAYIPHGPSVPQGDASPGICHAWQNATGDAGWGGVLAETFLADPNKIIYVVYEPGFELLPLFQEAEALLPPHRRWSVTFNTFFTGLPAGVACAWRGVAQGTPEAAQAMRQPGAFLVDLTTALSDATGGPLVAQARTGVVVGSLDSMARDLPLLAASPPYDATSNRSPAPVPFPGAGNGYELETVAPPSVLAPPPLVPAKRAGRQRWRIGHALALGAAGVLVLLIAVVFVRSRWARSQRGAPPVALSLPDEAQVPAGGLDAARGAPPTGESTEREREVTRSAESGQERSEGAAAQTQSAPLAGGPGAEGASQRRESSANDDARKAPSESSPGRRPDGEGGPAAPPPQGARRTPVASPPVTKPDRGDGRRTEAKTARAAPAGGQGGDAGRESRVAEPQKAPSGPDGDAAKRRGGGSAAGQNQEARKAEAGPATPTSEPATNDTVPADAADQKGPAQSSQTPDARRGATSDALARPIFLYWDPPGYQSPTPRGNGPEVIVSKEARLTLVGANDPEINELGLRASNPEGNGGKLIVSVPGLELLATFELHPETKNFSFKWGTSELKYHDQVRAVTACILSIDGTRPAYRVVLRKQVVLRTQTTLAALALKPLVLWPRGQEPFHRLVEIQRCDPNGAPNKPASGPPGTWSFVVGEHETVLARVALANREPVVRLKLELLWRELDDLSRDLDGLVSRLAPPESPRLTNQELEIGKFATRLRGGIERRKQKIEYSVKTGQVAQARTELEALRTFLTAPDDRALSAKVADARNRIRDLRSDLDALSHMALSARVTMMVEGHPVEVVRIGDDENAQSDVRSRTGQDQK